MAAKYKINVYTLKDRIKNGWTWPEIFKPYKAKVYTICGEEGSLSYFAKKYGINETTLIERIKVGVPEEELLDPGRRKRTILVPYKKRTEKPVTVSYVPAPKYPGPEHPKLIEGESLQTIMKRNAKKEIVFIRCGAGSGFYWYKEK